MEHRIIDPPRSQFERLPTQLTPGERQLIDFFDEELSPNWEMYVQPHLNGLRPDLVLLNPSVGIAVFEVKDWNLNAMEYFADGNPPRLMARNKYGKIFSKESENPVKKILLYEDELFNLYCPRLDHKAGRAVITAGLVFTRSSHAKVKEVFDPFLATDMCKYPRYYPIAGSDDLEARALDCIFPEHQRSSSIYMSKDTACDLRGWLREPAFAQEQRYLLSLNSRQRYLAQTRTKTGYRRVKGPAGSGKSVVLSARAAELADSGKRVLVVCYNITLLNYLRDLTVRHETPRKVFRRRVEFLNFHLWCKRICMDSGYHEEYNRIWRSFFKHKESDGELADEDPDVAPALGQVVELVQDLYTEHAELPKYDAILVDEGQDFDSYWWQTLRHALVDNGEMMLVADKTQNIYGTAGEWTEKAMKEAGFYGPWSELKTSYRLSPSIILLVSRFAKNFLTEEEVDLPRPQQEFDFSSDELRWVQVRDQRQAIHVCEDELKQMMQRIPTDTAFADIVFLSDKKMGREVAECLKKSNVHVLHTFSENNREGQRQKRAFFQRNVRARIRATTPYSFKGWEARLLVLFVNSISSPKDKAVLYTALTRVRKHELGCHLTVISCCKHLESFGRTWPDFDKR